VDFVQLYVSAGPLQPMKVKDKHLCGHTHTPTNSQADQRRHKLNAKLPHAVTTPKKMIFLIRNN